MSKAIEETETVPGSWASRQIAILWQDLRLGARVLRKTPVTIVILLSIAIGIGVNSAVFALLYAVLLRPLPYRDPHQLVMLWAIRSNPIRAVSPADYFAWRDQARSFVSLAAFSPPDEHLFVGSDFPINAQVCAVSTNLFSTLGVDPYLGRPFYPEDERPSASTVLMLSYALWQRNFGARPDVIGRPVRLGSSIHTIIGVMPAGFVQYSQYHQVGADAWVPLVPRPQQKNHRYSMILTVLGRLSPNTSIEAAQTELSVLTRNMEQTDSETHRGMGVWVTPLHEQVVSGSRPLLLILGCAAAVVLLIACCNVASLQTARALQRDREVAIRIALGASRFRLIRQLLTENALLCACGAGISLLICKWTKDALISLAPEQVLRADGSRIDAVILLFTVVLTVCATLISGLLPAVHGSAASPNHVLNEAGGRSRIANRARGRSALVTLEVGLTVLLLFGAGAMGRTLLEMTTIDHGFSVQGLWTMRIPLTRSDQRTESERIAFFRSVMDRLASVNGIGRFAATTTVIPSYRYPYATEVTSSGNHLNWPHADIRSVTPDYFAVMGIAMHKGREFLPTDDHTAPDVTIVNRALAQRLWPDSNPVGRQLFVGMLGQQAIPLSVIGVADDTQFIAYGPKGRPEIYVAAYQHLGHDSKNGMTLVLRGSVLSSATQDIRRTVVAVNREQPLDRPEVLAGRLDRSVREARFLALLLGLFAVISVILAASGVYALLSYHVTQRIPEIGVRVAVGATPLDILRIILNKCGRLVGAGLCIGLLGVFGATKIMPDFLRASKESSAFWRSESGISTFSLNWETVLGVIVSIAVVSLIASAIPAYRAARIDPVEALRRGQ